MLLFCSCHICQLPFLAASCQVAIWGLNMFRSFCLEVPALLFSQLSQLSAAIFCCQLPGGNMAPNMFRSFSLLVPTLLFSSCHNCQLTFSAGRAQCYKIFSLISTRVSLKLQGENTEWSTLNTFYQNLLQKSVHCGRKSFILQAPSPFNINCLY